MSRVPFQFLMLPVGGWAPTNVPLGLVERVVYAAYHDRYRAGMREIVFRSGELEAVTGVAFRTCCTARVALISAGLLREVRKGGGRGKPSAFAIVENYAPAARIDGADDTQTMPRPHVSESGNSAHAARLQVGKGATNPAEFVGNGGRKRAETPLQTLQNRPTDQIRSHARAHEGELGDSPLAADDADQTSENHASETVKNGQGISRDRGTPRQAAGAPPLKRRSVWARYQPTGFEGWVRPDVWDADQAKPPTEREYELVSGGPS